MNIDDEIKQLEQKKKATEIHFQKIQKKQQLKAEIKAIRKANSKLNQLWQWFKGDSI